MIEAGQARLKFRQGRFFSLALVLAAAGFFYLAAQIEKGDSERVVLFGPEAMVGAQGKATEPGAVSAPNQESYSSVRTEIGELIKTADPFGAGFYSSVKGLSLKLEKFSEPSAVKLKGQLTAIAALESQTAVIRASAIATANQLDGLVGRGGPLYKSFVAEGSPFGEIAPVLEALKKDFGQIASGKPVPDLKAFETALKTLPQAREKLASPEIAAQLNERRKSIVQRIDGLAPMTSAKEWSSAVAQAGTLFEETASTLKQAEQDDAGAFAFSGLEFDRQVLSRMVDVFGACSLLLAVILFIRGDRLLIALAEAQPLRQSSPQRQAVQGALEAITFLQLITKQVSDLGKQVGISIKKFASNAGPENGSATAGPDRPAAPIAQLESIDKNFGQIIGYFSDLKERTTQLSIRMSEQSELSHFCEDLDAVVDIVESLQMRAGEISATLSDALSTSRMRTEGGGDAAGATATPKRSVSRDAEGLLVVISQWTRHFNRLSEAVIELEQALVRASESSESMLPNRPGGALQPPEPFLDKSSS